jgi:hypothetical protein
VAAQQDVGSVSIDGHAVRSSDELPEFAVGPDGTVYAVWQDARFTRTSKIAFSQSTDGGQSWSAPIRIGQSPGDVPASWASGGETKLSTTGSFDPTTAPDAGGYVVGDYDGLTSTGATFDPFFGMAKPIATAGRTDTFSNTAG